MRSASEGNSGGVPLVGLVIIPDPNRTYREAVQILARETTALDAQVVYFACARRCMDAKQREAPNTESPCDVTPPTGDAA